MNEKTLGQDRWFRLILVMFGLIGLISMVAIALSEKRCPCFKAECFEEFLLLFKFPFQVFGAGLAVAAVRGVVFRSEQTAKQISLSDGQVKESIKQNSFKNYFDHKKDFDGFLDGLESEYGIRFIKKSNLYSQIFPKNGFDYFSPNSEEKNSDSSIVLSWQERFSSQITDINDNPKYLFDSEPETSLFVLWLRNLAETLIYVKINISEMSGYLSVEYDEQERFGVEGSQYNFFPEDLFNYLEHVADILDSLMDYCPNLRGESKTIRLNKTNISAEYMRQALFRVCNHSLKDGLLSKN